MKLGEKSPYEAIIFTDFMRIGERIWIVINGKYLNVCFFLLRPYMVVVRINHEIMSILLSLKEDQS